MCQKSVGGGSNDRKIGVLGGVSRHGRRQVEARDTRVIKQIKS